MFDELAEDLFNDEDLTVEADFTPSVGDPVTGIRVNLVRAIEDQPGSLDAQVWGTETTIEYLLDDIGREVDEDEVFTINETDYTVTRVMENDGRFVKVAVK
jgi:hypothetical protein